MHVMRIGLWISLIFLSSIADIWSAEPEIQFNLLSLPSSRQADLRLAMPTRMNYEHAPLRACMRQLAERFQFSYWIDRRVDADRPLTIALTEGTLRECLTKLARACDAEVGLVENVVTIAKPEHLAAMQYAAVRLHNQLSLVNATQESQNKSDKGTGGVRQTNAELRPLVWPKLTTPNEFAELVDATWKLNLKSELPHDLMNEGQLQPCTVSTQLALLYGGFDRCAAGKRLSELRVLPMPKPGPWQASYPSGRISTAQVQSLKQQFADAQLEKSGSQWTLVGTTAAHLCLLQSSAATASETRPTKGPRTSAPSDPLTKQRFDISKQEGKPIGAILKNLGDQLGLTIQWDESLPPAAPHTLVTIEANKARLDEILADLGNQAKLAIDRDGTQVSIRAMPKP